MKAFISLVIASALVAALAGCGAANDIATAATAGAKTAASSAAASATESIKTEVSQAAQSQVDAAKAKLATLSPADFAAAATALGAHVPELANVSTEKLQDVAATVCAAKLAGTDTTAAAQAAVKQYTGQDIDAEQAAHTAMSLQEQLCK